MFEHELLRTRGLRSSSVNIVELEAEFLCLLTISSVVFDACIMSFFSVHNGATRLPSQPSLAAAACRVLNARGGSALSVKRNLK